MKAYVRSAGTESTPGQTSGWMGIAAVVASLLCILLPVVWRNNEVPRYIGAYLAPIEGGGYLFIGAPGCEQPYEDSLSVTMFSSIALGVVGVVLAMVARKSGSTDSRGPGCVLLAICGVGLVLGMLLDFLDRLTVGLLTFHV